MSSASESPVRSASAVRHRYCAGLMVMWKRTLKAHVYPWAGARFVPTSQRLTNSSRVRGGSYRVARLAPMLEPRYNPHSVEERWQQTWEAEGLYNADPDPT